MCCIQSRLLKIIQQCSYFVDSRPLYWSLREGVLASGQLNVGAGVSEWISYFSNLIYCLQDYHITMISHPGFDINHRPLLK